MVFPYGEYSLGTVPCCMTSCIAVTTIGLQLQMGSSRVVQRCIPALRRTRRLRGLQQAHQRLRDMTQVWFGRMYVSPGKSSAVIPADLAKRLHSWLDQRPIE
jgi:hypothetical protein